jgi:hypothetical protein
MANGRAVDWEDPDNSRREVAGILDWDPISELHRGRRSYEPHPEAGHMPAPDHVAEIVFNPFAGGGRPHMKFSTTRKRPLSGSRDPRRMTGKGALRPNGGDGAKPGDLSGASAIVLRN